MIWLGITPSSGVHLPASGHDGQEHSIGSASAITEISRFNLAASVAISEDIYAHPTPNVIKESDKKIEIRLFGE